MSAFAGDITARRRGWLARVDGRTKFLFAFVLLGAVLASKGPSTPALAAGAAAALLVSSRVAAATIIMRLLPAVLIGMALFTAYTFLVGSDPTGHVFGAPTYREGFDLGLLLFCRIVGAAACLLFLVLATPAAELVALARWLRLPATLVELLALAYRFTFLLFEELVRIQEAMQARLAFRRGAPRLRNLGVLAGNLFIRAYERSRRVATAMRARGYAGRPVIDRRWPFSWRDLPALAFLGAVAALFVWRVAEGP
ncbi:MAG: cobalt ECF transporter T component CbiQ [Planctomycetes bacterium]|nr:cobalt ECF transporter T component CbiQ [Planctomycetota bacterium]